MNPTARSQPPGTAGTSPPSATNRSWTAASAALWSGILLFKVQQLRIGGRLLILYIAAVAVSAFNSPSPGNVVGYWMLLAAAGMLSIGFVNRCASERSLRQVEYVWLTLVSLIMVEQVIMSSFQEVPEWREGPFRLTLGDQANGIGMTAVLLFWISFWLSAERARAARLSAGWILRFAYLATMILTRSRVAIIAFVVGGGISSAAWFVQRKGRYAWPFVALVLCAVLALASFASLAEQFQILGVDDVISLFNRNEDVGSLTGRTEIWPYALERIFDNPLTILFGHGYGISRLILAENWKVAFHPTHSHNAILESILSTGIIGGALHLLLLAYSATWLIKWRPSYGIPPGFNLRAIAVISALLTSLMTESFLVVKLEPLTLIFLFYAAARDAAGDSPPRLAMAK